MSALILYRSPDGVAKVEVTYEGETFWISSSGYPGKPKAEWKTAPRAASSNLRFCVQPDGNRSTTKAKRQTYLVM